MKHSFFLLAVLVAVILFCPSFAKEQAVELTPDCSFSADADAEHITRSADGRYDRYWNGTGGALEVTLPSGASCQGISLSFFGTAVPLAVETQNEAGEWTEIARYTDSFLNAYIPFKASGTFRLRAVAEGDEYKISALSVWGEGTLPDSVQRWEHLNENADLMLIVTHPDDDLVWFGGLLPTYAGEYGKKCMVVYLVGEPSAQRKNELLDGLWTCGIRYYPEIGPFYDLNVKSVELAKSKWGGEDAAPTYIVRQLRHYKPLVVVSQDIKGEYGHCQHLAAVEAVIRSVTELSHDAAFDPASAEAYGTYAPQKLYLHRLRKNEITFDWTQPLSAFDGRTGQEVAAEAFKKHVSQQKTHYHIYMGGSYDSQRYGLYYSTVGLDEAKNDLFEHVSER